MKIQLDKLLPFFSSEILIYFLAISAKTLSLEYIQALVIYTRDNYVNKSERI